PGRYDPSYETHGRDYPRPYVRWTVARNFEAVLDAIAGGQLSVEPLISRTVPHASAAEAYQAVLNDPGTLGAVFSYPEQTAPVQRVVRASRNILTNGGKARPVVGVIGAGNFTRLVLLPAIRKAGAEIAYVASAGGVTGLHSARKFEAESAASDPRAVLADPRVSAVFIATRHGAHAAMAAEALEAGKHVFVEKPLAIDEEGLERVRAAYAARPDRQLMVGFNRRFAPHTVEVKRLLASRSHPLAIQITVNAGAIPPEHWTQDAEAGGGRMIGEGCHFIDLAMHLVGGPITSVQAAMFGPAAPRPRDDKMSVILTLADGSLASLHYWANGPKSYPKERVEIFSEGRVLVIDNWRRLVAYDWPAAPRMSIRQDKGHNGEVSAFIEAVRAGGPPVIPFDELELVTRASFAAVRSAREGVSVSFRTEAPAPERPAPELSAT
ncbi:MAG: Gfo/Idh/MocA family oxidoreductase, partial [Phycisphaerae bacterium]